MNYLGIDPSLTGTGVVLLNFDGVMVERSLIKTTNKLRIDDRLCNIVGDVFKVIRSSPKDTLVVAIEGLAFGAKGHSMLELAGLHYVLRHRMYIAGHSVDHIVPPMTLKKWVCGKGNAKKEQMLLQAYKKFGVEFTDNNLCDAYCLARYAMEHS